MSEAIRESIVDAVVPATEEERVWHIDNEVERCWREADNLGWHKSWDALRKSGASQDQIVDWVSSKLLLIVSEVTEAQDELRTGHALTEVYFSDPQDRSVVHKEQVLVDGAPTLKPEGFLVELADAWIRINDLVGLVTEGEPSFGQIVLDKLAFNATRGTMHGGKAF